MRGALVLLLLSLGGCEGVIVGPLGLNRPEPGTETPPDDPPIVTACTESPTPGTAPLRRLTHEEYQNALVDLFGDVTLAQRVTQDFVQDPVSLGFRNSARFLDVKLVMAQAYLKASETVASEQLRTLTTWLPCASTGGEPCAQQLIDGKLKRLYRRPLTTAEQRTYLTLFRTGSMGANFATGIEWMLVTALQSPHFLYRPEVEGDLNARALTPHELATRLSFLLWRSIPDEALLLAAEQGRLVTKQDVEREARRMLEDPKAERIFEFFEQWLDIDEVNPLRRDANAFSDLPATLSDDLRTEARELVRQTVLRGEGGGTLEALFSAPHTYVNTSLAAHYGVPAPQQPGFQKISWVGGRGGLFMSTASLVSHDKLTRTSIVNRGLRVRTLLLCQTVPAPPDDVPLNLGAIDTSFSQAERLAQHRTNPSCAGCHALLDPLGQPFENIDAVGRARTVDEAGRPIVTTGSIAGASVALNGPVTDGADLMRKLAQADEVRECVVTQAFRFSHGREEEPEDLCSRQRSLQAFKDANWNVKELFVALAQTDDFLNKPAVTP